jgi:2,4-dienoyl-CoA reductase-like NADH-dependent reductase (Old Yellow Enzyme family)
MMDRVVAGSDLNLAGWAKRITRKPTITVGSGRVGSVGLDRELLEASTSVEEKAHFAHLDRLIEMRERGDFDVIAVGRAIIANPDWPNKVRSGNAQTLVDYDVSHLGTLE